MTNMSVIDRGSHALVEVDQISMLVSKRFYASDAAVRAKLAQFEFDYLSRFSASLSAKPFISCPEPVCVDLEIGAVWMTYCPAPRLDHTVRDTGLRFEDHIEHLAEQLALALESYVSEFNEPYFDLSTKHIHFDVSSRAIWLIDFTGERRYHELNPTKSPFEASLGIFIGRTIYDTVRPSTLINVNYWTFHKQLASALLRRATLRRNLCSSTIAMFSDHEFRFRRTRGHKFRRLWFSTMRRTLFKRRFRAILEPVIGGKAERPH